MNQMVVSENSFAHRRRCHCSLTFLRDRPPSSLWRLHRHFPFSNAIVHPILLLPTRSCNPPMPPLKHGKESPSRIERLSPLKRMKKAFKKDDNVTNPPRLLMSDVPRINLPHVETRLEMHQANGLFDPSTPDRHSASNLEPFSDSQSTYHLRSLLRPLTLM